MTEQNSDKEVTSFLSEGFANFLTILLLLAIVIAIGNFIHPMLGLIGFFFLAIGIPTFLTKEGN